MLFRKQYGPVQRHQVDQEHDLLALVNIEKVDKAYQPCQSAPVPHTNTNSDIAQGLNKYKEIHI